MSPRIETDLIGELEFRWFAKHSGQVLCLGHEEWWLRDEGCTWCGAVV